VIEPILTPSPSPAAPVVFTGSRPAPSNPAAAPGRPLFDVVRSTVAPVVASLPVPATLPPMRRRTPSSADTKLLAIGGAVATCLLVVAIGVIVGRTSRPSGPAAAAPAAFPVVVEAKAAAIAPRPRPVATPPVEKTIPVTSLPVERTDIPATIDVQQLPHARASHGFHPKATALTGTGASISPAGRAQSAPQANGPSESPSESAGPSGSSDDDDSESATTSSSAATPSATPPTATPAPGATVDPFVQAVREDIREDEAKTR
jgi:hypothetical protein